MHYHLAMLLVSASYMLLDEESWRECPFSEIAELGLGCKAQQRTLIVAASGTGCTNNGRSCVPQVRGFSWPQDRQTTRQSLMRVISAQII